MSLRNNGYTDEYNTYIESKVWKEKRKERFALDKYICCYCDDKAVVVHHRTYKNFGNEPLMIYEVSVVNVTNSHTYSQ